ncbi:MAG: type IX secretion system membrane protein PorP/SprF, partial [Sphingobacteriales bacterium]
MMMKRYLLGLFFTIASLSANAQDHIFSQFYNAPIYLNPALTGQFDGDLRISGIYRNQWSALGGDFSYMNASVDLNIPRFNSGLGISFNRSSEGTAYLSKTNIAASYAYIIGGDDYTLSFGLQTGITNRKIDWNKLVFGDQIGAIDGYIPGSASGVEPPDGNNKFFFDAAAGINAVYKNLMVGFGMHHINKPDESISGQHAILPIRSSISASYMINVIPDQFRREGAYLIPSIVYYKQKNVYSMSIGSQFKY